MYKLQNNDLATQNLKIQSEKYFGFFFKQIIEIEEKVSILTY